MIQERLLQLNLFNSPLLTICMRSHSVTITISKFISFCDMTEWLQAKTRLLSCTQAIVHTYYIMSHQKSPTTAGLYLSNKSMSYIN